MVFKYSEFFFIFISHFQLFLCWAAALYFNSKHTFFKPTFGIYRIEDRENFILNFYLLKSIIVSSVQSEEWFATIILGWLNDLSDCLSKRNHFYVLDRYSVSLFVLTSVTLSGSVIYYCEVVENKNFCPSKEKRREHRWKEHC